jgi:hypothetical protein
LKKEKNAVISPSPSKYVCKTYGEGAKQVDKLQKSVKSEIDANKITVSHKMIDGTLKSTIENYIVPLNETTAIIYDLISSHAQNNEIT